MRLAVGGIHIECCTDNPVQTRLEDFQVARGAELSARPDFQFLGELPHPFRPTLYARAIPGGPVAADAYRRLRGELLERLAALAPLDGLYLAMHGAMYVEGMEDADGDWIAAARATVGNRCLIAASYDLHGNMSRQALDALDIVAAYRTAPHIDVIETRRRAAGLLVRCLVHGIRPVLGWASVPALLGGERTSTVDEPARSLYAQLERIDSLPGVLEASLFVGYARADEPRAAAGAIVTGTDAAAVRREAARLAQQYWDARTVFRYGVPTGSLADCFDRADASPARPVIVADSGDNPTAGGVGDRAEALALLLARGAQDALVAGIADPPAVEACYRHGVGGGLRLSIGAALDPAGSRPVVADADVRFLQAVDDPRDRQAVVAIGGVTVVLTARRRPFHDLADFAALGLDPAAVRLLVVKSGYLSPELAPLARPNLLALSDGAVDQRIERRPRRRMTRPMFPFDRDFAWSPQVILSARGC